jgi:hypoxanthine-guanine phosphoribosyltransferase
VFFRYSLIPDIEMREVIQNAISLDNAKVGRYAESINDKNVLLIDDSVAQGDTISSACEILKEYFVPKTISVLTLFSRQY